MKYRPTRKRKTVSLDQEQARKRQAVVRAIRSLPSGFVSTYGAIARAAGWPGAARQVVRVLRQVPGLPWHRVLGSAGAIKLPGESGAEQRFRLQMERVGFRGARVDMKKHEFRFGPQKKNRKQLKKTAVQKSATKKKMVRRRSSNKP